MRTLSVRGLALACIAVAAVCVYSCSDDSTTCPRPTVCPDPSKELVGNWVVFEAFSFGSPDALFLGMTMDFHRNDTVLVHVPAGFSSTFWWVANDTTVLIAHPTSDATPLRMRYEFEADTLTLSGMAGSSPVVWRFRPNITLREAEPAAGRIGPAPSPIDRGQEVRPGPWPK